jgi:DNA-binding winged helix-turn-helix (wHTH) protein/predicted ATPase
MKHFLRYRFDKRTGTLWCGREQVRVTRKASSLLACLVDAAGATVSHETILSSVWPGTHVQAENIKVIVHELRTALRDDAEAPRFIRSDPGRGYTFIAPIVEFPAPQLDNRDRLVSSIFINHVGDLARLVSAAETPAPAGGTVSLIEGERGMGKTALCDAFMQRVRTAGSARVCYGQAISIAGATEPFLPVLDALHHLTRQAPAVVPALLARHAPSWLARLPRWIADAAPAFEVGAAAEPSRMLREAGDLFEAIGADMPTVMVLEDLQCADLDTVELLRVLARRHEPIRTNVVATYTPFAMSITASALRGLASEIRVSGRIVPIRLQPLREEHVRTYLAQRFGAGPIEGLARMLHQLCGGNPLVMVTTMDALISEGYIGLHDGSWRLHHPPRTIEASLSRPVLDSVLWWLDQLDAGDRAILEFAATSGAEFSATDVARAAEFEAAPRVGRRLETLCDRGYVVRRGRMRRSRPTDGDVYRFQHPSHAELLSTHAPVFEPLGAAARALPGPDTGERLG